METGEYREFPALTLPIASRFALLATSLALLAGCAGGVNFAKVEADRSIITGSVRPSAKPAMGKSAPENELDEIAIRNAVTSADIQAAPTLAWENPETGSRGLISQIRETREANLPCRSFRASRHAFDGILLYEGKTCLAGQGRWQMREYRAVGTEDLS